MKKAIVILGAFALLVACAKEAPVVEEPIQENNQELKLNINITREGLGDTKASVKSAWADGDVVFVFFNGVAAPKYVEMKYEASSWGAECKNGMGLSDLAASGTLTAVYLPYGSTYTVAVSETAFTIKNAKGEDYSGHFYTDEKKGFTFDGATLTADIHMVVPTIASSDRLVHFDVTGYTTGHSYEIFQDYVRPLTLTSIEADGTVSNNVGNMGDGIVGYIDSNNSIVSFSGVLDNSVVDNAVDYWFAIRDFCDGTLYYRDAGTKTISTNKYIGLGSFGTKWNTATVGEFTVSDKGKKVAIARSNLAYFGASNHDYPWRLMKYPWSLVETGPDGSSIILGEYKDFSLLAWATSGYADPTRPDMDWTPWRTINGGSKYGPAIASGEWTSDSNQWDWAIYNDIYEFGGNTPLSGWRTPTADEWINIFGRSDKYIFANATVNSVTGMMIFPDAFTLPTGIDDIVNLNGYMDYSANVYNISQWNKLEAAGVVFLPAAGCSTRATLSFTQVGFMGYYQSSTANGASQAHQMRFSASNGQPANSTYRQSGFSVRLVRVVSEHIIDSINVNNAGSFEDED